jgi:hypothetical protein
MWHFSGITTGLFGRYEGESACADASLAYAKFRTLTLTAHGPGIQTGGQFERNGSQSN